MMMIAVKACSARYRGVAGPRSVVQRRFVVISQRVHVSTASQQVPGGVHRSTAACLM